MSDSASTIVAIPTAPSRRSSTNGIPHAASSSNSSTMGDHDAGESVVSMESFLHKNAKSSADNVSPHANADSDSPSPTGSQTKSSHRNSYRVEDSRDNATPAFGSVLQHGTSNRVMERRLIYTSMAMRQALRPPGDQNTGWLFGKLFDSESFCASGRLHILPGCVKPLKNTKDNTYIFYVIEGAVQVTIHNSRYTVASDGTFLIPRGNIYSIQNVSDSTAKLMFFQAKEVGAGEDPLMLRTGIPIVSIPPTGSKSSILIGFFLERFLKLVSKYHSVAQHWFIRAGFELGRKLNGPRAYWWFFLIGFMLRGFLRVPGALTGVNVQLIQRSR